MRIAPFFLVLFLLIYLSEANAQSGSGVDFINPNSVAQATLLPPVSWSVNLGNRIFFSQEVYSTASIDTHLPARQSNSLPNQNAGSENTIFWNWLVYWFFQGKYRNYNVFTQYFLPTDPPAAPKKIVPLFKKELQANKIKISENTKTMHSEVKKKENPAQGTVAGIFADHSDKLEKKTLFPPQSFEELKCEAEANEVDYSDVESDEKPESLHSVWAWNIIGWVDSAFKLYRLEGADESYSFDDVVGIQDPALPLLLRAMMVVILQPESTPDIVSKHNRNLIIHVLDYILIQHKIWTESSEVPFNWRQWLLTPPCITESLRFQNKEGFLPLGGISNINERYGITEQQLRPYRMPKTTSLALWLITKELDNVAECANAQSADATCEQDLILFNLYHVFLFLVFNSKSQVEDKNCYLMEYWTDVAFSKMRFLEKRDKWKKIKPKYTVDIQYVVRTDRFSTQNYHQLRPKRTCTSRQCGSEKVHKYRKK